MLHLPVSFSGVGPRRFDVVGLGEATVDHYCVLPGVPTPGGKVRMVHHEVQGGGQVATAMLACQRLGLRARFIGRCGDDEDSRQGLAELRAAGVEVSGARLLMNARSQLSLIWVDAASGERTIAWTQDAHVELRAADVVAAEVTDARVLHVDATSPEASAAAVAHARAAGALLSIDVDHEYPGLGALLRATDLCVVPQELAARLSGSADPRAALRGLRALCPMGLLVVTRGAAGAMALEGERVVDVPAFPVRAVDTTGCGDAFHAGLIVAVCQGQPLEAALRSACAVAALNARRLGARAALPTPAEVAVVLATGQVHSGDPPWRGPDGRADPMRG